MNTFWGLFKIFPLLDEEMLYDIVNVVVKVFISLVPVSNEDVVILIW